MADAKDILGLTRNASAGPPKSKLSRDLLPKKPDGVSREVYALMGGVPPIIPSGDIFVAKGKVQVSTAKKVSWTWSPFTTSARNDGLQLHHWMRVVEGAQAPVDYAFAKYNKAVDIVRYTPEEYEALLQHPRWTRDETEHLFDLCARFDLRFVVIADRFGQEGSGERSVEDLKDRYYSVARKVLLARAANGQDVPDVPLLKEPFNAAHEVERKRALSLILSHSRRQEVEEQEILAEARGILEAGSLLHGGTKAAGPGVAPVAGVRPITNARTGPGSTPEAPAPDISALAPSPRPARVYMRGVVLAAAVAAVASTAGARMAKRIDQTLEELGVRACPQMPTRAVCTEHLALRRDVFDLLNLQKRVQWKENEVALLRENPQTDTFPVLHSLKRARGTDAERVATRAAAAHGDTDSAGDRPVARKGHSRAGEMTQQPKRSRKLKVPED